jgi:circadian clock protein KaiC
MQLDEHISKGLLKFHASRPTTFGLEMHLVMMYKMIQDFRPEVVVLDPITNLDTVGSIGDVKSILTRLVDFLQSQQITVMFTALTFANIVHEQPDEQISSLVDVWIQIRDIEFNGERNRGLYIMKSRGIKHSNQVREFVITDHGVDLEEIYMGEDGVLTGSAREAHKMKKQTEDVLLTHSEGLKSREISRRSKELEAKIAALTSEFESVKDKLESELVEHRLTRGVAKNNRLAATGIRERNQRKSTPRSKG